MAKKVFYNFLSVSFFVILVVFVVMITNTMFNSSSDFFERFADLENIYQGITK